MDQEFLSDNVVVSIYVTTTAESAQSAGSVGLTFVIVLNLFQSGLLYCTKRNNKRGGKKNKNVRHLVQNDARDMGFELPCTYSLSTTCCTSQIR
jgi:hypothetical protein